MKFLIDFAVIVSSLIQFCKKKLYHRGQIVDLYISEYAFGGKGISKIPTDDGHFIVFVQNAFPGQNVRAKIS